MSQKVVVSLDGRVYYHHDANWYDKRTHVRIPVVEANKVDALVRKSPELLAAIVAERRTEQIERHKLRLAGC